MYPVSLYLIDFSMTFNLLFLYDHVLWSLVVALQTVIDIMIDIPCQIMNNE